MDIEKFHISQDWENFHKFCHKRTSGVLTGIDILDRATLGLRLLTCIRGSPGTNKSSLALQIAKYYAENNGPVIFYDRENGVNRLKLRLLCQELTASEIDVVKGKVNLDSGIEKLKKIPFFIYQELSLSEIDTLLSLLFKKFNKAPLLIIDSLHKLPIELDERRASLDKWVVGLDLLKVKYEHEAKFIFISEKNKSSYFNADMQGSKDTGAIEYAAELIIDLQEQKKDRNILCTIAKDRDGPCGYAFELERVLVDPTNDRSFCYKLTGAQGGF